MLHRIDCFLGSLDGRLTIVVKLSKGRLSLCELGLRRPYPALEGLQLDEQVSLFKSQTRDLGLKSLFVGVEGVAPLPQLFPELGDL